jgi:HAD superfamily hydrolase (TIGR01509 family)
MAPSAVLFDLDGTLWDSHPWFARLIADTHRLTEEDALARLRSLRPAATMLRDSGITRGRFRRLCQDHEPPSLYPGAEHAVRDLDRRHVPLAAVTNLPAWIAGPMLDCLGLDDTFSSVVTWERTTRRKPRPDPLYAALDDVGVPASTAAWYIGDSASDCEAAVAAGISFGWARWGYADAMPSGTARTLRRLRDVLDL